MTLNYHCRWGAGAFGGAVRRTAGQLRTVGLCLSVIFFAGWSAPTVRAEHPRTERESLEFDEARGVWVQREAPEPGTPEGDLWLARAEHAEGRYRTAYRHIRKWLKVYGDAHVLYPEAAVLRAQIEIARRDYYKAHKHLQEFLNEFGATRAADEAIDYEFVIADVFLNGTRRKFLGMRMLPAEDIGIRILDDLSANYPGSSTAELALKTKADYFFRKGDFSLAEMEYTRLGEQFPQSRYLRYGLRRSADAALASFPGIEFDDAALIEAETRFQEYLTQYPGAAEQEGVGLILDSIREKRAAKELHIGDYYRRTKQPRAAAFYYRSTIKNWPETVAARGAFARLDETGFSETPNADGKVSDAGVNESSESEEAS